MSSTPKRDEYEEWCENNKHQVTDMPYGLLAWTKRFADAALAEADERIAELEAENKALMLDWQRREALHERQLQRAVDEISGSFKRAEQAEADARKWKARQRSTEQNLGYEEKLRGQAEAEAERLKCCGNCQHINCDEYQECHHPQTMDDEWDRIYYVSCWDSCHFTPSRWAERGGEKPRCT